MTDYMIIPKSFCEFILSLPEKEGLLFFEAIGAYMKTGEWDLDDPILDGVMKTLAVEQRGRTSQEYRRFRRSVLERDDYTCQFCGCRQKELHVHHIKPFADYPWLRTDVDNGITLCPNCHREVHSK